MAFWSAGKKIAYYGKFEGAKSLQNQPSPSPLKERGIKGER